VFSLSAEVVDRRGGDDVAALLDEVAGVGNHQRRGQPWIWVASARRHGQRQRAGNQGKVRPSGRADTGHRGRQIHASNDAGKSLRAITAEVRCFTDWRRGTTAWWISRALYLLMQQQRTAHSSLRQSSPSNFN
jgi:hypothetical protein